MRFFLLFLIFLVGCTSSATEFTFEPNEPRDIEVKQEIVRVADKGVDPDVVVGDTIIEIIDRRNPHKMTLLVTPEEDYWLETLLEIEIKEDSEIDYPSDKYLFIERTG